MVSDYATFIGVTDADAHTARNIYLSVADCKHLVKVLQRDIATARLEAADGFNDAEKLWSRALVNHFKHAVSKGSADDP